MEATPKLSGGSLCVALERRQMSLCRESPFIVVESLHCSHCMTARTSGVLCLPHLHLSLKTAGFGGVRSLWGLRKQQTSFFG